jgi:hypothetical protein
MPRGGDWAPTGADSNIGPIASKPAARTPAARVEKRASGVDSDRASLTHEADGNGGLVLRSDR